jgi:uncharacterized protein (TIGR02453 family)
MSFPGFADKDAKFFRALAKNQTKAWFQAHKDEFEDGYHQPMKALLADVREAIDRSFPHVDLDEPRVFRIYRDVRFSKDKSPYKTHVGGVIPVKRTAKMTEVPIALYFHVGEPRSFGAAGHYMMDAHALEKFRQAVADVKRGKELDRLLGALVKKGFSVDSHDTYKRVPKGYDPDHPRAAHLKRKGLTVGFPQLPKGILTSPKLVPWVTAQSKAAASLVEWLVFATI